MSLSLRQILRKSFHTVERPSEAVKRRIKKRWNLYGPIKIQPYRGFGNRQKRRLLGRVMEDKDIGSASDDDPWWRNAAAMVRRFRTEEIPGCRLEGRMLNERQSSITDHDGYFQINFQTETPPTHHQLWYDVDLRLLDDPASLGARTEPDDSAREVVATGRVLIPPADAEFGVISDIDDTIIESSAADLFRLAKLTFFNNAYTRTPFPKVSAFYRALQRGSGSRVGPNPIFYVSSSAWNLYDLFDDFMRVHRIPEGPILLRDLSEGNHSLVKSNHEHKLHKIAEILGYYPELPFLLIGDSGQRDPWLYQEIVRRFPGRIAAIYIRDVSEKQRSHVDDIAHQLKADNVDMILMPDAESAAQHAASLGLIASADLGEIAASDEEFEGR